MYKEETSLQEQVNNLSEELRQIKMQLQVLYRHFGLSVSAKREVTNYIIQEYKKDIPGTAENIVKTNGLQGLN